MDLGMDVKPYFKVHNLVSVHPKSIIQYLVKWPISTWSFTWWCQFIDWLKLETRPSSLLNFRTLCHHFFYLVIFLFCFSYLFSFFYLFAYFLSSLVVHVRDLQYTKLNMIWRYDMIWRLSQLYTQLK